MKSFSLVASLVFCWFALASASYGQTATTKPAENITQTTATLKGEVNAGGVSQSVIFELGLASDPDGTYSLTAPTASPSTADSSSATTVSGNATGLVAGTKYKYRIKLGATTVGDDVNFFAAAAAFSNLAATPQITTASVTADITPSSGTGPVTSIQMQFGQNTSYGTTVNASPTKSAETGTAAASVSATAAGLLPSTPYHFRFFGTDNNGQLVYSADATFTTKATDGSGGSGTGGGGSVSQGGGTGVLVYNMEFKHLAGFNIDFFEEGYVIVPATGGDGEVIFKGRDNGKLIYSRQTGVKFFIAKTRKDRYAVVTMSGTSGATVSMQAYGRADDKVKATGTDYTITVKASKVMRGLAQAARDESSASSTTTDNEFGFVEFAEMKLDLNERETDKANHDALTVAAEAEALEKKLGSSYTKLSTSTTTDTSTDTTTN